MKVLFTQKINFHSFTCDSTNTLLLFYYLELLSEIGKTMLLFQENKNSTKFLMLIRLHITLFFLSLLGVHNPYMTFPYVYSTNFKLSVILFFNYST